MGWFDKESQVKEIEHVRGSKISSARPSKKQKDPRWYDPSDPTTHDLPARSENWTGEEAQALSRELVFEDIELDPEVPTKHLVIAGGTGSGKTQAIHRLLDRVLWGTVENKEKAIITDSGGQFFSTRSRKNDLLLNPFDGRSVQWNPFLEIEDQWDYDSLAESLFPLKEGHHGQEDEWVKKARGLIASIMKGLVREGTPDPKRVIEIIQPGDPELLRPYITGTPEEALLMPMNERFLGSVIGEASLVLRP
ncbi:MAG: type IV secretion system DNA-binding domain-containing protein, partial [Leptospirillum sp.]